MWNTNALKGRIESISWVMTKNCDSISFIRETKIGHYEHLANHRTAYIQIKTCEVWLNKSTLPKNGLRWTVIEVVTPSPRSTDSCFRHAILVTHMITGSHITTTQKPQFSEEDPWSRVESSKFCPTFAGVNVSFHLYRLRYLSTVFTFFWFYSGHFPAKSLKYFLFFSRPVGCTSKDCRYKMIHWCQWHGRI